LTIGSFVQTAPIGTMYVIINGGAGGTGTGSNIFAGYAEGSTYSTTMGGNQYQFTVEYAENATGTGSGTDVVLDLTSVPEPGTWGSILGGLGLLGLWQRRAKRAIR